MLAILFGQLAGAGTLMAEQPGLMPTGISRKQFAALLEYTSRCDALEWDCIWNSTESLDELDGFVIAYFLRFWFSLFSKNNFSSLPLIGSNFSSPTIQRFLFS
jgi:hypothetical protein